MARRNSAASHLPVRRAGAAVHHPGHCALHTRRILVRLQLGPSPRRGRHTAFVPARVATCTPRRLSNNRITGMPAGLFRTNTVLKQVTLNDNAMTSLPAGVFGTKSERLRSYVATRLWNTAAPRATIRVAPCSAKHSNACSWTRPYHNKVTECLHEHQWFTFVCLELHSNLKRPADAIGTPCSTAARRPGKKNRGAPTPEQPDHGG